MKIILAAPIYPPDIGGPATFAQNIRQGLGGRGIDVGVVSYAGLKKIPQPLRMFFYFAKLLRMSLMADIIYALNVVSCGIPAYAYSKIAGKKFFIRIGGDFLWERAMEQGRSRQTLREYYENPAKTLWERIAVFVIKQVLSGADKIIFTSDFQRQIYVKHYGFEISKTVVIKNPFPAAEEVGALPREGYQILYAGRLLKLKNLELLIKEFHDILSKTDKHLTLKIVGEGPEKEKLLRYNKVTFAEPMTHRELMKEISKSYMCVLPSLTEITPNFALECLALGKPILLTKENGLDIVRDNLILIDPKDEDDLANKILFLLDEKNYNEYVERIKRIPKDYTWDNVIKEHEKSFISWGN